MTPINNLDTPGLRPDSLVLIPRVSTLCIAEINLIFIISIPELNSFISGDKNPNQFPVQFGNMFVGTKFRLAEI